MAANVTVNQVRCMTRHENNVRNCQINQEIIYGNPK